MCLYLILLRVGFTLPHLLPVARCALTAPFHPYRLRYEAGGIFSAALSVGSRLPGITWHPALWSPDFPPFYLHKTATVRPTLRRIIQATPENRFFCAPRLPGYNKTSNRNVTGSRCLAYRCSGRPIGGSVFRGLWPGHSGSRSEYVRNRGWWIKENKLWPNLVSK